MTIIGSIGQPEQGGGLRPPLRLAVVLDATCTQGWIAEMLRRLATSPHALIVVSVVLEDGPSTASRRLDATSPVGRWGTRLVRWAERLAYPVPADARAIVDVTPHLQVATSHGVELPTEPIKRVPYQGMPAFLRDADLDVVLWLSHLPRPRNGGAACTYGLWMHEFGRPRLPFEQLTGYWEVLDRCPVTASYLVAYGRLGTSVVLCRSMTATDRQSTGRNSSNVLWKSAAFAARAVASVRLGLRPDLPGVVRPSEDVVLPAAGARVFHMPSSRRHSLKAARHGLVRVVQAARNRTGIYDWVLRVAVKHDERARPWRSESWACLSANVGHFWADPMAVRAEAGYYVFVEEYVRAQRKARIAVVTLDERGRFVESAPALEEDYHLSYPFVFEYGGCWYMVPDSSANRSIDVYECIDFPQKWVHALTLFRGLDAADTTLVQYEGRWWLFTAVRDVAGSAEYDELFVFWSDSPLSTHWTPHPQNPLVSDARRARPAGRFLTLGDDLYRPSQDCSVRYGYGVRVNKVTQLTSRDYEEVEVDFVEPDGAGGILATHTLSLADGLVVMDGFRWHQ